MLPTALLVSLSCGMLAVVDTTPLAAPPDKISSGKDPVSLPDRDWETKEKVLNQSSK